MYCKFCGRQMKDDARFCPGCGKFVGMESREEETEEKKQETDRREEAKQETEEREGEQEKINVRIEVKKPDRTAKKGIVIIAVCFLAVVIAGISIEIYTKNKKEERVREKHERQEKKNQAIEEEYAELISEGDALAATDHEGAIEKYKEAYLLFNTREEAYRKSLEIYIAENNTDGINDMIFRIENFVSSPSQEVLELIKRQREKGWYLVKSRVSVYEMDDNGGAARPMAGELTTSLSESHEFYYKYDSQGRLIESNAGSLPSIYAKNDGTYRPDSSPAYIDRDIYRKREGENADTIGRDPYCYPDLIDSNNIFTYEYNDDGTVLETVTRDGEIKDINRYRFDGKLVISQEKLRKNDAGSYETKKAYSDFKYYGDYVSFHTDKGTSYWEEGYGTNGILNKFMIEISADGVRFGNRASFRSGKSMTDVKLNYYFEDVTDAGGNISQRTLKYDLVGGALGGRNQDGTYYEWITLQKGLLSRMIEYKYVYCGPDEINEKAAEVSF